MLRRIIPYITPAEEWWTPSIPAWLGISFTYQGLFIGAHISRQFEFLQSQWITDGNFIGRGTEQDPMIGNSQGDGIFTIPQHTICRRLYGVPQFVAVKGGEDSQFHYIKHANLIHLWITIFYLIFIALIPFNLLTKYRPTNPDYRLWSESHYISLLELFDLHWWYATMGHHLVIVI